MKMKCLGHKAVPATKKKEKHYKFMFEGEDGKLECNANRRDAFETDQEVEVKITKLSSQGRLDDYDEE